MKDLLDYLNSLPSGPVEEKGELESLLSIHWDEFRGAGETSMSGKKLFGRMEQVEWNPPILSFRIDRHGGTIMGSSRADIYSWQLNMEDRTAKHDRVSYRQLTPHQPPLDTKSLAKEITQLIFDHKEDEKLKWNTSTGEVQIMVGEIIPKDSAKKPTLESRRKRFHNDLHQLLTKAGWREVRRYTYSPPVTTQQE